MTPRVFVITSERYYWALSPFIHLFQTYWSTLQPVLIAGFSPLPFHTPSNYSFFSMHNQNLPADRWSNGLIRLLSSIDDEHIILFLEDYWLTRTVDVRGVQACYDYIKNRPEVLRIDLTADRLYAGGMFDVEGWGCYDIIETPHGTPYQMSTQAAMWNRMRLLEILQPNKSAWEVEVQTQPPAEMRVLGTRQYIVRYANAVNKGKLDPNEIGRLPEGHRNTVLAMIPEEWKTPNEH